MSPLRSLLALAPEQRAALLADLAVIGRSRAYDVAAWLRYRLDVLEREEEP